MSNCKYKGNLLHPISQLALVASAILFVFDTRFTEAVLIFILIELREINART